MAELWLPASACPHRAGDLYCEIRSAEAVIVQCRCCKSVWNHETVPLGVLEEVKQLLDQGAFVPMGRVR
jgi:hypothetical protein